jgi:hypothetical protein
MLSRSLLVSIFAIVPIASYADDAAAPADNSCPTEQANITSVTAKYKTLFDGLAKDGDDLKNSDDAKPFKVDITWADTSIIFDTPSVTVKDQKFIFGVPQITMKTNDIIFGTPSVRMQHTKTGQYPETTCHDTWITIGGFKTKGVPACTITWHDIYTDIPVPFIQQQHIKMDIPELKIADTTIVFGVPEFFMQQQKIVFGVPQFTGHSVLLDPKPLKDKAEAITNEVSATKAAQATEMGNAIHGLFVCFRTKLSQEREAASAQFTTGIAQMDGIIQSLRSQGADPTKLTASDGSTTDLVQKRTELAAARDSALKQFDDALSKLDQSEKDTIAKLSSA